MARSTGSDALKDLWIVGNSPQDVVTIFWQALGVPVFEMHGISYNKFMQSLGNGKCEIGPGICAQAYNQGSSPRVTMLIKSKFGVGGHCDNVSHQVHKTLYFYSVGR